jgi:hypothetical protein
MLLSNRRLRQDRAVKQTVADIKAQGDALRANVQANYHVTIEDAIVRLQRLGANLAAVILFLSRQLPNDSP